MGEVDSRSGPHSPRSQTISMGEIDSSSGPRSQTNPVRNACKENKNFTCAPETWRYKSFAMLTKQDLKEQDEVKRRQLAPGKAMFRVREDLRERKPEHYVAQNFSLGLFDRFSLDMHQRIGEKWKLRMAGKFLDVMGFEGVRESAWEQLCKRVVPDPVEIQDLYVESRDNALSAEEVQIALTLDAVFVTCSLLQDCTSLLADKLVSCLELHSLGIPDSIYGQLCDDILKVENQIPVSLIRNVLHTLVEKLECDLDDTQKDSQVETLLTELPTELAYFVSSLLPGAELPTLDPNLNISLKSCDGFLDYTYHRLIGGSEAAEEDRVEDSENISLPTAAELQKAGVQFVGRKGNSFNVDFDPGLFTATLYLPFIEVYDNTEALWSNLLAHEDIQTENFARSFTYYVYLMDSLIDSPNDVNVLRSGTKPVIDKGELGEEDVTRIFNNTLMKNVDIPFESKRWNSTFNNINKFYNRDLRKMFWEFVQTNFGKPWLTISVIAATVLLIMTFLQTYYTMAGYYQIN